MSANRRVRLWSLLVEHALGGQVGIEHVCAVAMSAAGVDGVVATVVLDDNPREAVYASGPVATELEDLALTLGEGPGVDAVAGSPVLVADVTAPECLLRWPVFAPAAAQAGVHALFALPLQAGAVRIGVLGLHRACPGGLDGEQLADALVLADTACALLLDREGHTPAGAGGGPEQVGLAHPEVHQATGMITVQLGVTAAVALIRLRAYAFANDRRLRDVAGDVVARRLRFDSEPSGGDG